jgi:hypothetical protein
MISFRHCLTVSSRPISSALLAPNQLHLLLFVVVLGAFLLIIAFHELFSFSIRWFATRLPMPFFVATLWVNPSVLNGNRHRLIANDYPLFVELFSCRCHLLLPITLSLASFFDLVLAVIAVVAVSIPVKGATAVVASTIKDSKSHKLLVAKRKKTPKATIRKKVHQNH